MDILTGRVLLTPADPVATHHFYGELLGLAVAREFGSPDHRGVVYFFGGGLLEVSGRAVQPAVPGMRLWMQVRDVQAEYERLLAMAAGDAVIRRPPQLEPWGLVEMWLQDPDGVAIAVVEVPADHPLRRDQRT